MFAALLVLSLPAASTTPAQDFDRERLVQVVRDAGREATTREGVPGVSIAVARDGEFLVREAFGSAGAVPLDVDTRFEVGSLTRQLTAVALLQLVAAGKCALDDELVKHLPGFPTAQGSPTLRQILASRSGVPGWERILAKHPEVATRAYEDAAFLALFADTPFAFAPGTDFSLDTAGYALLALAIEKLVEAPFPEWIQGSVVELAGLETAVFCPLADRPAGYAADCKEIEGVREIEVGLRGAPRSATRSLCATAADVARFQTALFDYTLLDEAGLRLFLAPSGSVKGPDDHGASVHTSKLDSVLRHAHSGGTGGYRVVAAYYPAEKLAIAVLANCATAEVDRIEEEIARVAHNLPPRSGEFPLLAAEERRLPGTYQLATTRIRVFHKEGHLWFEEPGQPAVHLRSRGRGDFALEGEREARVVFDLEAEKAAWFKLTRGGATSRAIRVE